MSRNGCAVLQQMAGVSGFLNGATFSIYFNLTVLPKKYYCMITGPFVPTNKTFCSFWIDQTSKKEGPVYNALYTSENNNESYYWPRPHKDSMSTSNRFLCLQDNISGFRITNMTTGELFYGADFVLSS